MDSLGTFSITAQDSMNFARVSGDFNPLHLNPVAARRTRFGQTLIHGVSGTLKALDLLLEKRGTHAELASIKVKYNKPAAQGQKMEAFESTLNGLTRVELFADGTRCQVIDLDIIDCQSPPSPSGAGLAACTTISEFPADIGIADCEGLAGTLELRWDAEIMNVLYPSAARLLPAQQLSTLLASTQIVGMKCPGLHSVYAQLRMQFAAVNATVTPNEPAKLDYRVVKTDARIDRVELALNNTIVEGTVEAFFRPPPVQQAGIQQIAELVGDTEFNNQKALVIGGSRGLGEVISKVLAAGGADVMITYAAGKDDAVKVADEIGDHRPTPVTSAYNVLEGEFSTVMEAFCASVTHIYYLASPTIAKNDSNQWDRMLFDRYCDFYIDGLSALLQQVLQRKAEDGQLTIFIPSSVFLEEKVKGFDEYIAAKSAAEAFVRSFAQGHRQCRALAPRLPRLYTDQTSSIKNTDEQQTLNVIIEQLRKSSNSIAD